MISSRRKRGWKINRFRKTTFLRKKITIARILRLCWIQICIWFNSYDNLAPTKSLQWYTIAVILENVSTMNPGVSIIAVEALIFLFWTLYNSKNTLHAPPYHCFFCFVFVDIPTYYCCKDRYKRRIDQIK